jgi:hypothetical protein
VPFLVRAVTIVLYLMWCAARAMALPLAMPRLRRVKLFWLMNLNASMSVGLSIPVLIM